MKKILTLAMPVLMALAFVRPEAKAWDIDAKYTGPKTPTTDISWHPDVLPGYEARYVNQGEQFDGPCRSTIVRLKCRKPSKKGFLYIHGFNDYFFQSEMGERFVDSGYHFYAVDLRRYGRSKEPWQYPYN
ncbi:MAG: lysophospholipase, partial [Muribaculaceae bacterium]|nr:lysophospholipase [Muribaculaceae bacterium]